MCVTIQNTAERKEGRDRSMFLRNCRYFAGRRRGEQCLQTEKYYEEVRTMYLEMRAWRHDYKNHLQVMKAHLDMGEYQELADYMLRLDEELTRIDKVIKTGSLRLDAILNSKIALAKAKQIQVNVKVILPPHISVSDYDLCVLLGNLLDNAIRACQEAPMPRSISVMLLARGELWEIEMINSGSYRPGQEPGSSPGKEGDGAVHGLGLVSVGQIVEKYQGSSRLWQEDGQVRQKVILVQRNAE